MPIAALNFSQRGAMSSSCAPGWPRRPSLGRRIVPELFDDTAVGSVSHNSGSRWAGPARTLVLYAWGMV